MSVVFGIFRRDDKSIDPKEAKAFAQACAWWEPDALEYALQGSLLLGQATLYNTPQSHYEHLPLRQEGYIAAIDARIDNREELALSLELPNKPLSQIGDGTFILAAYKKWGEACVDKLQGDFTFVIWDETQKALFCAKDFIGTRPFYYYADETYVIFSSDLRGMHVHPKVPKTLREASIVNYLVYGFLSELDKTFFEGVKRLEGGCRMRIDTTSLNIERYWHPNRIKKIDLPNKQAYATELRRLLEDAVKARMRTAYNVSAHLSGGLDSSPICVLAARELAKEGKRLDAYVWQHPPHPDEDPMHHEIRYPELLAKQEKMRLHYSHLDAEMIYRGMQRDSLFFDGEMQLWYEEEYRPLYQASGVRTVLSGWGGDELATQHAYAFYAETFRRGEWGYLWRTLRARWQREGGGVKSLLKLIYFKILVPQLPNSWYCKLPKVHCKRPNFSHIAPHLRPLAETIEAQRNHVFSRNTSPTLADDTRRAWENGHLQSRLESWALQGKRWKVEYAYPLLDRRLVELALSIPARYMIADGFDRSVYREAVSDLLPKEIIWGIHKSEPRRWEKVGNIQKELYRKIIEDTEEAEENFSFSPAAFKETNCFTLGYLHRSKTAF